MDENNRKAFRTETIAQPTLRSDENGTVSIEFAFVAPILVILTLGVVEATNLLAQYRKVSLANETMVDLIARLKTVGNSDATTAGEAVNLMLSPHNASYTASVAIIQFDSSGNPDFSNAGTTQFDVHGSGSFTQTEMTNDTSGLSAGSDAVVIGKISSTYVPILFPNFLSSNFSLSTFNAQRPRQSQITSTVSPPPPPPSPPPSPPSSPPASPPVSPPPPSSGHGGRH